MSADSGLGSELESFRQKWLSDLRTKREGEAAASGSSSTTPAAPAAASSTTSNTGSSRRQNAPPSPRSLRKPIWDEGDYLQGYNFDELPSTQTATSQLQEPKATEKKKKLVSALDHFEEAMQKEAIGNMGDSLKLYRQAYRLDHTVDKRYREKYFPPKPTTTTTDAPHATATTKKSSTETSAPTKKPTATKTPAQPEQGNADEEAKPLTIKELLASFAALKIEAKVPDVEGEPPLPCPISELPDELLVHIMLDVAVTDIANFARLALVCKRMAYLVATEQRIWRQVCIAPEFGFAGMHRRWRSDIEWTTSKPSGEDYIDDDDQEQLDDDGNLISPREMAERDRIESYLTTCALTPTPYPSWKAMFRHRPRVRFNGCYISTVNYIRSGAASTNQSTWGGSPIHIITYYRYLRLFRDGSLISLLTTHEPAEVVHHLTREQLLQHHDQAQSHLPSAVMHLAHRGRWRLSSPVPNTNRTSTRSHPSDTAAPSGDADLYVETEGVGTKYLYRMDLTLRSAGKASATKNNKLVWRAFYSYNKLTDDWGEFTLKNDKPFFFSRVRSYGLGE